MSYFVGSAFGTAVLDNGLTSADVTDSSDLVNNPALASFIDWYTTIAKVVATLSSVRLGGFIVSIVATALNRGRTFIIWGIVSGLVAPILGVVVFTAGLAPVAGQFR